MIKIIYKILHNLSPTDISNHIKPNEDNNIHNFHSQAAVKVTFARLETFKRSFIPHNLFMEHFDSSHSEGSVSCGAYL